MAKGKVKWFDNKKGFGFIAIEDGQDVFVHYSEIKGTGYRYLDEGQEVEQQTDKIPLYKVSNSYHYFGKYFNSPAGGYLSSLIKYGLIFSC